MLSSPGRSPLGLAVPVLSIMRLSRGRRLAPGGRPSPRRTCPRPPRQPRSITMVRSTTAPTMRQVVLDQEHGHAVLLSAGCGARWPAPGSPARRGPRRARRPTAGPGSPTRARASSTRRHEPRPRALTGVSARSAMPTSSSTSATRASRRRPACSCCTGHATAVRRRAGPVRPPGGVGARSCRGRPRPAGRCARCPAGPAGRPAARRWPSPASSTRPRSGRSWPQMQLNRVVLPAPLGPTRPTLSPGGHRQAHVADGGDAPERLGDVGDPSSASGCPRPVPGGPGPRARRHGRRSPAVGRWPGCPRSRSARATPVRPAWRSPNEQSFHARVSSGASGTRGCPQGGWRTGGHRRRTGRRPGCCPPNRAGR